jgi:hypothetical protein
MNEISIVVSGMCMGIFVLAILAREYKCAVMYGVYS